MSGAPSPSDMDALRSFLIAKMLLDKARNLLPWYDSSWLHSYVAAVKIIERVRPHTRAEFIEAFARLRTRPDFCVKTLDRVFDDNVMELIRETIRALPPELHEQHEIETFGRIVVHNHPFFNNLLKTILPLVSELAEEPLEPSYNFLSLYTRFGVCHPHMDSPAAKWTLDLCIDQSDVWPIYFSQVVPWPETFSCDDKDWQNVIKKSPDLKFSPYNLRPGEAVLFSGSSQWHYRDSLTNVATGAFCNLLFFHFFPAGMSEIIRPKNWPALFGVPELAGAVGLSPLP